MTAAILLLLILIVFIVFLFTANVEVKLLFDSDASNMNLQLFDLASLIKGFIMIQNGKPTLIVFLQNKKIYEKVLGFGKNNTNNTNGKNLVKAIKPKNIHINAFYGFADPFNTGVACGAVGAAIAQFSNIDHFSNNPDFMSEKDYIYIDATARIKVGSTLVNIYKNLIK